MKKIDRPKPPRHLALLIVLLLLFVVAPFVVTLSWGVILLNIIGAAVLLLATYALSERRSLFPVAVCMSIISIMLSWLVFMFHQRWAVILSHVCILILLGFFSISMLTYVVRAGRVTADKIYGSICVYLLIGYSWAFAYALLEEVTPGSFTVPGNAPINDVEQVMRLRYFSFVTLTTVGYGDVLPVSPPARTLATLEAIMGQIFLTVLVARLVGLHIVHANNPPHSQNIES